MADSVAVALIYVPFLLCAAEAVVDMIEGYETDAHWSDIPGEVL